MDFLIKFLDGFNTLAREYSYSVNLLLTTFIVGLTAWYAIVTRRMWREMVDSRVAAIRPLLDVRVHLPEFSSLEGGGGETIVAKISVTNFGRGPAFAVSGDISLKLILPHEQNRVKKDLTLPTQLAPGEPVNVDWHMSEFETPLIDSLKDFLVLRLECFDAEGNKYVTVQFHDLIVAKSWRRTDMRYEAVKFESHSNRRRGTTLIEASDQRMTVVSEKKRPYKLI